MQVKELKLKIIDDKKKHYEYLFNDSADGFDDYEVFVVNKWDSIHLYGICPYCNKEHKHGSGRASNINDARKYCGTRSPHCKASNAKLRNYILVMKEDIA